MVAAWRHPNLSLRGGQIDYSPAPAAVRMTSQDLADAIRSGDRAALPRAITLLESTRADHREQAQQLLLELLPDSGNAHRVGITGDFRGRQVDHHRSARHVPDRPGPPGGGAGRRPVIDLDGRTIPRRQDPDGAAAASRPYPALPTLGTLGGLAKVTREDSRPSRWRWSSTSPRLKWSGSLSPRWRWPTWSRSSLCLPGDNGDQWQGSTRVCWKRSPSWW